MTLGRRRDRAGRRRTRKDGQRGAVLVEFGIIAVLLFTLLFGIVEFGWAFFQKLDVRHGAREGARLAAVNYGGSRSALLAETCDRLEIDNASVRFSWVDTDSDGQLEVGEEIEVEVRAPLETLTGFFDDMLGGTTLSSTVFVRAEQDADWASSATAEAC